MTGFMEREQAFEAKYAHDEELRFLVAAHRDKLLAGWAAERLHMAFNARSGLVASILAVREGHDHDKQVLATIAAAYSHYGNTVVATELAAAMEMCADQARCQLMADVSSPGKA